MPAERKSAVWRPAGVPSSVRKSAAVFASVNMSSTVVTPNAASSRSAVPHECVCESMSPGNNVLPVPSTTGVPAGAEIDGATRAMRPFVTRTLVFGVTCSPSNRRTF